MVGFPGETDGEFRESYDFIAALPLTYLHIFPFSPRPGTPGWELHRQNPVPGMAVKERIAALRALVGQKNLAFRSSFVGRQLSAVTLLSSEAVTASQKSSALTDNFLTLELHGSHPPNALLSTQVTSLTAIGLQATAVDRAHTTEVCACG
jgi:threonylcarbamoyladenosine tRNA methylthiotransferase MtaB